MELFDRAAAKYQARSGDTLSDAMKIGIALRQMAEGSLRQHLVLNSTRLVAWKDFKQEVTDVQRALASIGPVPMDVGAVFKGGKSVGKNAHKNGKGKGMNDAKCRNCGRAGHFARDCAVSGSGKHLVGKGGKKNGK